MSERCMVIGVSEAHNLGDLAQYYCAIKLINKYFPSYKIELVLPNADQHLFYLKSLKLDNTDVISISRKPGALELISPLLLCSPKLKCLNKMLRVHAYYLINRFDKLIHSLQGPAVSFIVLGGHTYQIDNQIYERLYKFGHTKIKITFPISIETSTIRYYGLNSLLQKKILKDFDVFNYIFTRGPLTLNLLQRMGVERIRQEMALDSTFYIKSIFPLEGKLYKSCNDVNNVAVIPRVDMFRGSKAKYNYLVSLAFAIKWLIKHGYNVYLTSMAFRADKIAIDYIVSLIKNCDKNLRTIRFSNLRESWSFYNSIDITITSRMHDGIMTIAAGKPALFITSSFTDTKVMDVFSYLNLNPKNFMIDALDPVLKEVLIHRMRYMLEHYEVMRKIIKYNLMRVYSTVELPVKTLKSLLEDFHEGSFYNSAI